MSRTLWTTVVGQPEGVPVQASASPGAGTPTDPRQAGQASTLVHPCPPLSTLVHPCPPLSTLVHPCRGLYGPPSVFLVRKFPFPPALYLPSPSRKPPSGSEWVHEIKHDGYRLIARRDGKRVRLFTRRGYNWSVKFPGLSTRFCPFGSAPSSWTGKRSGLARTGLSFHRWSGSRRCLWSSPSLPIAFDGFNEIHPVHLNRSTARPDHSGS
jgi:hypothetical protein